MYAAGTVYFLRAPYGDAVKIGFTTRDPVTRLREAQTYHSGPLTILAETPGTLLDEARLHRAFWPYRLHGEWFSPAPRLMELIHALCDGIRLADWLDASE